MVEAEFVIRLSEEEYEGLKELAKEAGAGGVAQYLRHLASGTQRAQGQTMKQAQSGQDRVTPQGGRGNSSGGGVRKTAIDVLKEQGATFQEDVAPRLNNVEAYFSKLASSGAVVIDSGEGKVAFDPEFYKEFTEKLSGLPQDEGAAAKLLEERMAKIFTRLIQAGAIYFDHEKKTWMFVR
jgi:hypothetical protein